MTRREHYYDRLHHLDCNGLRIDSYLMVADLSEAPSEDSPEVVRPNATVELAPSSDCYHTLTVVLVMVGDTKWCLLPRRLDSLRHIDYAVPADQSDLALLYHFLSDHLEAYQLQHPVQSQDVQLLASAWEDHGCGRNLCLTASRLIQNVSFCARLLQSMS